MRDLQAETGGFTEFVPLPFVHMEAPIFLRRSAQGPTFRETVLMHAVARLVLHPADRQHPGLVGEAGRRRPCSRRCRPGANDLGGVLMNESITRAAGGAHGQELDAAGMQAAIRSIGRQPRERTTLYGTPPPRDEGAESTRQAAASAPA